MAISRISTLKTDDKESFYFRFLIKEERNLACVIEAGWERISFLVVISNIYFEVGIEFFFSTEHLIWDFRFQIDS